MGRNVGGNAAGAPLTTPAPDHARDTHLGNNLPRLHLNHQVAAATETNLHSPVAERARTFSLEPVVPQNDQPQPHLTSLPQLAEPAIEAQDAIITPLAITKNTTSPISVIAAVVTARQSDSSQSPPPPHRKPNVKVLAYATEKRECLNDVEHFRNACLSKIAGLDPGNIQIKTPRGNEKMYIGEEFDEFFNPQDIVPGDVRILLVTGYGRPDCGSVRLDLYTPGGGEIDTEVRLQLFIDVLMRQINKLPEYCTLEVVLGTCHAEGVVPAQYRVRVMGSSSSAPNHVSAVDQKDPHSASLGGGHVSHGVSAAGPLAPAPRATPASPPSPTGSLGPFSPLGNLAETSPLNTKANVIVWAAAELSGWAFTEVLPKGEVRFCAMIGPIIRAWNQEGPNVTRRVICDRVHKSLEKQCQARFEADKRWASAKGVQDPMVKVPQIAVLLSTSNDPGPILDGCIFRPLGAPLTKSLTGCYSGGEIGYDGVT